MLSRVVLENVRCLEGMLLLVSQCMFLALGEGSHSLALRFPLHLLQGRRERDHCEPVAKSTTMQALLCQRAIVSAGVARLVDLSLLRRIRHLKHVRLPEPLQLATVHGLHLHRGRSMIKR